MDPSTPTAVPPLILVVDDENQVRRAHERILTRAQMSVIAVADAAEALSHLDSPERPFDAVVSDVFMPGMDGVGLLREVRKRNLDIPVIIITGNPQLTTAIAAMNHGGFRYLVKPVSRDELVATVTEAVSLHRLARLKREALSLMQHDRRSQLGDRASLEVHFAQALQQAYLVFQPIVDWLSRDLFGYEAYVRSHSPILGAPVLLLDAAVRLGRVADLGRVVRRLAAARLERAPLDALLFLNLCALELEDPELLDPKAAVSRHAWRIVLDVSERDPLEEVDDAKGKLVALRQLGYRIALDDFGSGHAVLAGFSQLDPDFVKLDVSLVRDITGSKVRQSLVRSMIAVCTRELGIDVICEGVETVAERDTLEALGATLYQGYLFGHPSEGFASVALGESTAPVVKQGGSPA